MSSPDALTFPPGRLCELHGYAIEAVLRPGDGHKARVLLGRKGDRRCIIKDLAPMRPIYRVVYGRRMLAREERALRRLDGFDGTPRFVERLSRDAIAIEFVPAIYLRKSLAAERKPAVLRAFAETVDRLHARGVIHLDLRQRKNVLVLPDDRVLLIDFESCFVVGKNPFSRWLGSRLAAIDRGAVLKWQAKYLPKMVSKRQWRQIKRQVRLQRLWFFKGAARRIRTLLAPRA